MVKRRGSLSHSGRRCSYSSRCRSRSQQLRLSFEPFSSEGPFSFCAATRLDQRPATTDGALQNVRPSKSACAQASERCPKLGGKELRLFPCSEVATFLEVRVMYEVRIRPLGPAPWGLILLARKHADGDGDRNALGVEEPALVFPV